MLSSRGNCEGAYILFLLHKKKQVVLHKNSLYPTPCHGKYVGQLSISNDLRCIAEINVVSKVQSIVNHVPGFAIVLCHVVVNTYDPAFKLFQKMIFPITAFVFTYLDRRKEF